LKGANTFKKFLIFVEGMYNYLFIGVGARIRFLPLSRYPMAMPTMSRAMAIGTTVAISIVFSVIVSVTLSIIVLVLVSVIVLVTVMYCVVVAVVVMVIGMDVVTVSSLVTVVGIVTVLGGGTTTRARSTNLEVKMEYVLSNSKI